MTKKYLAQRTFAASYWMFSYGGRQSISYHWPLDYFRRVDPRGRVVKFYEYVVSTYDDSGTPINRMMFRTRDTRAARHCIRKFVGLKNAKLLKFTDNPVTIREHLCIKL